MNERYTNPSRILQQTRRQQTLRAEENRRRVQARMLREQDRMVTASQQSAAQDHSTEDK